MRVLVCGGRNYGADDAEVAKMWFTLYEVAPTLIIHGRARGADYHADRWAKANRIAVKAYPADWLKYGPRAGPIRNQRMLDEAKPELVVAFPGGRGTADMVKRARAAGVRVMEVTT